MLQFSATFDLQRDVVSSIHRKEATIGAVKGESLPSLNSGSASTRLCGLGPESTLYGPTGLKG